MMWFNDETQGHDYVWIFDIYKNTNRKHKATKCFHKSMFSILGQKFAYFY
jgi:hypothetical protein